MPGFHNDFIYADNMDLSGATVPAITNGLQTDGQLWIGSTALNAGGTHVNVGTLTSTGGTVTISKNGVNINLETAGGAGTLTTLTPDLDFDGTPATPISGTAGNINILGSTLAAATVTETFNSTGAATGNLDVEHRAWLTPFVVDPSTTPGARGTFSTIGAAITAAVSGQTIFIRAGTYTENLTLKAGVNLCAFTADAFTPNVKIIGKCTMTTAGTVSISGIRLQTNSDFVVSITGSAASIINLVNCYLSLTNNTGINLASSSSSSQINIILCNADVGTTGIKLYDVTGAGALFFDRSYITNSGSSTTASTSSAGFVFWQYSYSELPMTTSSTSVMTASFTYFSTNSINATILTQGGSNLNFFRHCSFKSGTATAITISSGMNMQSCQVECFNADVISGAGTLTYSALTVNNTTTTWTMSVTTQVARYMGQIMYCKAFGTNYTATATSYTVLRSDCIIGVTSTAAPRTITMPASGMEIGQQWRIKDESGGAATNNITVSGNGANIDGAANTTININYGSIDIYWNGTAFFIV